MNGSNPLIQEPNKRPSPKKFAKNPLLEEEGSDNPLLEDREPVPSGLERFVDIIGTVAKEFIIQPLKDVSKGVVNGIRSGAFGRMPSPNMQAEQVQETQKYIAALPPEELASTMRGMAYVASFAGGPIVEAALPTVAGPVTAAASRFVRPGPLLGKWGSFLTGEFLGGGIFGGIRPLEEGESRGSAILSDAAQFAVVSGGLKLGSELAVSAFKRHILNMPSAKRKIALGMTKAGRDKIDQSLADGGVTLEQLPPDHAAKLEEPILREAIQQADPREIDFDAIVKQEADRSLEPHPRFAPEQTKLDMPAPEAETPVWKQFEEELKRIPGTAKGFEVTGARKTPSVPTEPTVTEILEGKGKPEKITGVAMKGASGKIYQATHGEVTHPELMSNLLDRGEVPSIFEFLDEKTGGYSHGSSSGFRTTTREFVSQDEAKRLGLEGRKPYPSLSIVKEQIIGPTVKGKSGKLYVGGATHPETMEQAIKAGVPESEFEGIDAEHPNRGFKTNVHDFVSREYAAQLTGRTGKLFSEDLHQGKMLPSENIAAAEANLENVVKQIDKSTPPEAVMDAALDHAVASIEPLEVSSTSVKGEKALVDKMIASAPKGPVLEPHAVSLAKKPGKAVQEILERALAQESPAAEEGAVLELTNPGPRELDLTKKIPAHVQKAFRKELEEGKTELAKSLKRDEPPISIEMGEQISAPWMEGADRLTAPKEMDGLEIGVNLTDKQLDGLKESLLKIARDQSGRVGARLMIATAGSAIEALSFDPNLDPAVKADLRYLGGFLLLTAAHQRFAEAFQKTGFLRNLLIQYNPAKVMSSKDAGLFKQFGRSIIESKTLSILNFRDPIRKIVPDKALHEAFMYAAEEGPNAPEWHLLSPSQQQAAMVLNQLELRRGMLLQKDGVIDEYVDNYVRHLLPPKTYEAWKTSGFKVLPTGGGFTKKRKFSTLRELTAWTQKEGLEGPIMDPAAVYSVHNSEAEKALATVRLKKSLERVGTVLDFDPKVPPPDKWRPIRIPGMMDKMAPYEVATALENIASPRASEIELVNALDVVKSYWMRTIMMWPWEHGFNYLRSIPAIAWNPTGAAEAWRAVKRRDPGLIEAAKAGVDLFSRPDYGIRSHDGWQRLLSKVHLPSAGAAIDRRFEMMDRWLWEQTGPAIQYFAYTTRMHAWAERTKGAFLPASAEYKAATHAAADFANTVAGRIPQELTNPKLARLMRFALFSPQWTMTRMALTAHAAGELSEIAAGRLNPKDAAYLPFKIRQLGWGIAITWLGSKLMSGQEPEFNPKNAKFYMKTGWHNAKGQEIGLDVVGWYETDIQLFNHPFNFMLNRLNPMVKVGKETIEGRDYNGRQMTTGQTIGNIISSFGAGAAALVVNPIQVATRIARGPAITAGEGLQMASRSTGAFQTATLPRPIDAVLGKYSKKLLVRQGIPATDDNIFMLSRLLRGNILRGRDLIDNQVINWLAYNKRSNMLRNPISSALGKGPPIEEVQELWQEARRVLAEF